MKYENTPTHWIEYMYMVIVMWCCKKDVNGAGLADVYASAHNWNGSAATLLAGQAGVVFPR